MIEIIFSVIFVAIFAAFYLLSINIPIGPNPNDVVTPSGFPKIFALIGMALLIWEIIDKVYKKKKGITDETYKKIDLKQIPKIFIIVLLTVLFIIFVKYTGFILFSLVYIFICLNILNSKKQIFNLIMSIATVVVLVIVFGRFFSVALPRGIGIIKELSFYLY